MKKLCIVTFLLSPVLVLLATGCQTVPYQGQARDVKLKPKKEGVLGLPINPRSEDRQVAETRMTTNCAPSKYEILEEGEMVVGQKTNTSGTTENRPRSSSQVGSFLGLPVMAGDNGGKDTQSSSVTESIKEWQISYKCLSENSNEKPTKIR